MEFIAETDMIKSTLKQICDGFGNLWDNTISRNLIKIKINIVKFNFIYLNLHILIFDNFISNKLNCGVLHKNLKQDQQHELCKKINYNCSSLFNRRNIEIIWKLKIWSRSINLAKAFETVNHSILLVKLWHYLYYGNTFKLVWNLSLKLIKIC